MSIANPAGFVSAAAMSTASVGRLAVGEPIAVARTPLQSVLQRLSQVSSTLEEVGINLDNTAHRLTGTVTPPQGEVTEGAVESGVIAQMNALIDDIDARTRFIVERAGTLSEAV